ITDTGMVESYAIAITVAIVDHGVMQPSRITHYRNSDKTKGIQLVQPTGLHTRRHKNIIGPGIDEMAQRLVIPDIDIIISPGKSFHGIETTLDIREPAA